MITLPDGSKLPLYQQLYQQLKHEIQSGNLAVGEKLPSKRKLSEQLGISINTVEGAYTQLEAEGFLLPGPRRGSLYWNDRSAASGRSIHTFFPSIMPQRTGFPAHL